MESPMKVDENIYHIIYHIYIYYIYTYCRLYIYIS